MANGTPPAGICELMRALQNSDNAIRSEAEKKLMEAVKGAPDQLVLELLAVLGASNESASVELRQEAVVVLRQCAMEHNSKSCWKSLQNTTKEALKEQILVSLTKDPSLPVRRNAANVVSTVASTCANSYSELVKEWPRLLLFLSETISSGQAPQVTACLKVLTELVDLIGEELLKQGPQTVALLQTCLQSPPGEVRAAAVQLLFQMVEDLEEEVLTPLGPLMPQTIEVIKGFAMASEHEDCLKETLEALISSAEEEPEFFKAHGLQQLWPLLLEMCKADHWADSAVRHSAMEAVMSFFEGLCEDFCKPEGLPFLEQLLTLNIQWMLEAFQPPSAESDTLEDALSKLEGDEPERPRPRKNKLKPKGAMKEQEETSEEDVIRDTLKKLEAEGKQGKKGSKTRKTIEKLKALLGEEDEEEPEKITEEQQSHLDFAKALQEEQKRKIHVDMKTVRNEFKRDFGSDSRSLLCSGCKMVAGRLSSELDTHDVHEQESPAQMLAAKRKAIDSTCSSLRHLQAVKPDDESGSARFEASEVTGEGEREGKRLCAAILEESRFDILARLIQRKIPEMQQFGMGEKHHPNWERWLCAERMRLCKRSEVRHDEDDEIDQDL